MNKEDKPTRFDAELIAPYFAMVLPVCCREEGSRKVIAAAVGRLAGVSVCVDDALDALCELTGENASEAVIEQVFERFCVGK